MTPRPGTCTYTFLQVVCLLQQSSHAAPTRRASFAAAPMPRTEDRTEEQPQPCSIGWRFLTALVQSKEEGACTYTFLQVVCLLQQSSHAAPTRRASFAAAPMPRTEDRTEEQPQPCSIGWRFLTALVQSKEEGGSLCRQAARESAGQAGTQFARTSHRRACFKKRTEGRAAATLLNWSDIPESSGAKKRGKQQPLSASSS